MRIKALISLFKIIFKQDRGVFPFCNIKVILSSVKTQYKGLCSCCPVPGTYVIAMNGNEEICFIPIGNSSPFIESNEFIRLTGIDDIDIWIGSFNFLA